MDSYYSTPMNEVNVLAKLADMKEEHYHQLVTLSAIMELLIEKGILTREEIEKKALEIDGFMTPPPIPPFKMDNQPALIRQARRDTGWFFIF